MLLDAGHLDEASDSRAAIPDGEDAAMAVHRHSQLHECIDATRIENGRVGTVDHDVAGAVFQNGLPPTPQDAARCGGRGRLRRGPPPCRRREGRKLDRRRRLVGEFPRLPSPRWWPRTPATSLPPWTYTSAWCAPSEQGDDWVGEVDGGDSADVDAEGPHRTTALINGVTGVGARINDVREVAVMFGKVDAKTIR